MPLETNSVPPHGRMQRLSPEWYQGHAFVLWTMTTDERKTGWLTPEFHLKFREVHLHTLARYDILCLAYCLMPDHIHLLWTGLAHSSDQDKATSFIRRYLNKKFPEGMCFQRQAWDVVLREKDRERDAVLRSAFYTFENPVRAGQVEFSGCQAAGYPELDWRDPDFSEKIWNIYEMEVRGNNN